MARKRKKARPADPMAIARRRAAERERARDPATWGLNADALDLAANDGVEVRLGPAGRAARARRQDVFDRFLARGSLGQGAHDAVRRLQDDIAVLHRTMTGGGDFAPRIDRGRDPQSFTDARRRAGERIEAAVALAGAASAQLLLALCESDVVLGRGADWRTVVAVHTAETMADAQGAVLRMACENLAGAYAAIDRGRPRKIGVR
ncbi:MAG: hypothetical protein ABI306_10470 [Caulobacteraceae bacterium]